MVHGFRTFDPDLKVAGILFNKVGSDIHEQLLREAVEDSGLPVLGALRRDERVRTPERHLGLVPVAERESGARAALDALAHDHGPPRRPGRGDAAGPVRGAEAGAGVVPGRRGAGHRPTRIAIARGPAFSFHYQENLELLDGAGVELVGFDPLVDEALPEGAGALMLAGGFPEVFGEELAANVPLREQVAAFAASGRPVLAECGGLLYLCTELDGHAMCGALPARGRMSGRLTLGYREAVATDRRPRGWRTGPRVRGHEFHYSKVEPLDPRPQHAWELSTRTFQRPEGIVRGGVQAGYLHVHWAAHPELAQRLRPRGRALGGRPP